jgi:chitin disaccharide deacetylase
MRVVINGDDFGRSSSINAAIVRAHREGVLTSASLMVTGEAAEEAVELARALPTLAVGLHLVVAGGRPVLPAGEIPHIVGRDGRLLGDAAQAGVRVFLSRAAQAELAQELRAQFERFARTGLPLSHVDGHMHLHMVPPIFRMLLPLAQEYGAAGVRIVRDDVWLALRYDRRRTATKLAWALVFGALAAYCRARLRRYRLIAADRVYGLMQTGEMQETYVLRLLGELTAETAELYCHPSLVFEGEALGPNPGDLGTLLSPAVRRLMQDRGIRLATYPTLRGG